ncbi:D-glycero-alpha-D-manno-heptose-1,7-bisphosphate 7-phosphatase [Inediibacterium massiliense]|uniref:D-glycero-alpha-D-manno-heptose-1,7-bisphosphate 7-phosphatase n=1 Tax=Inediibacterium massiliense TaxID=1658111 RepID=UPI0006B46A25|nr:HAD family hydrolase [Inediibacterium massiliense]
MYKAVFLDRDGVINDNKNPVNKPDDLVFYYFTIEALKLLQDAHFLLFVVTNQGGIEMGYFTEKDLHEIHTKMLKDFNKENIHIHEVAYCPHFKTKCNCRKPAPGMILDLAKKYHINLNASYMIGDRPMDIEAGFKAGCITIKIGQPCKHADYVVNNLLEAAKLITTKKSFDK